MSVVEPDVPPSRGLDDFVGDGRLGEADRSDLLPATGSSCQRDRDERRRRHGALDLAAFGPMVATQCLVGRVTQPHLADRGEVDGCKARASAGTRRFEIERERVPGVPLRMGDSAELFEGKVDDAQRQAAVGGGGTPLSRAGAGRRAAPVAASVRATPGRAR